jgi:hypothetical protein
MELQRVEQIGDTSCVDFTNLKIRKNDGKRKMFGFVHFKGLFDDDVKVVAQAYTKQGGEYRRLPYKIAKKGICAFCKEDSYFLEEMSRDSNFSLPFKCPFANVSPTKILKPIEFSI